ncbi:MAG: type II toxin-antitoxin system RelE/ParE family toxin [Proteobacteria bacterium]|nr:type II toxin-antitoxin system RelE/ParE family toxin [Pseudomonadota bacterium]
MTFDPPVRLFRYGNHPIVYRAENDGILIVEILQKRMDIPAKLGS